MILISADSPKSNQRFRKKMKIDFDLLSDEDHAIADRYTIPIQRVHPKANDYQDGFIQPAVFVFRGEEEIFSFIQKPTILNLWGASGRPTPDQILEAVEGELSS
jgi:peroxiredoxin